MQRKLAKIKTELKPHPSEPRPLTTLFTIIYGKAPTAVSRVRRRQLSDRRRQLSDRRRQSPTVADRRRQSPTGADSRRQAPTALRQAPTVADNIVCKNAKKKCTCRLPYRRATVCSDVHDSSDVRDSSDVHYSSDM